MLKPTPPEDSPAPASPASLPSPAKRALAPRWWLGGAILFSGTSVLYVLRTVVAFPYEQARTHAQLLTVMITGGLLLGWWLIFSRLSWRVRAAGIALAFLPLIFVRLRGVTGDLVPIFEYRFGKRATASAPTGKVDTTLARPDFPQLFGPQRDARLPGPRLAEDWANHPPEVVWRRPVGAAWGGMVVAGRRVITQEQEGGQEFVACFDLLTGDPLWRTANPGRYDTKIAGVGPRATPTIAGDTVFTLGALGTLRCLELATGTPRWTRELAQDAGVGIPDWGFASSPLVHDGKVIVSAGGPKSLFAYRIADGEIAWTAGDRAISYSSPFLYKLAGREMIVIFNHLALTGHDPATGAVLWEHPFGKGTPHVSRPVPIGDHELFVSAGYGVGSSLLELTPAPEGKWTVTEKWRTPRFQAKFSNPVERDGFLYGVSDGIFACLDLRDGKVVWKNGRYGHGQGLLIGEHYLQMTEEPGDLILLKPTPAAANELGRVPVFPEKTWNPLALCGDLLLVRNDREAACLRLPLAKVEELRR